jgi:3-dehydroquinate synthase
MFAMTTHRQQISITYDFPVVFTRNLFAPRNRHLRDAIATTDTPAPHRCLVLVDRGAARAHPRLSDQIRDYFTAHSDALQLARAPQLLAGGEAIKQTPEPLFRIIHALQTARICRHSYCIAVGGGAFLDAVGLAAALFHRGVRHIRIPTTALAQCDSGVGVKNAINHANAKNLLGTFAPPHAVLNDSLFLDTLPRPLILDGIAEAIKVAAIKDAPYFRSIERAAPRIAAGNPTTIRRILQRCALLHLDHIATSGDPFELGSARPLDYGHWSAHKLEAITNHRISHGHAVAIGICLDALYAARLGHLPGSEANRLIRTVHTCGLPTFHPALLQTNSRGRLLLLDGIEEFRAHLGGQLTLTIPAPLGSRIELHEIDIPLLTHCLHTLSAGVSP